MPSFYLSPHTLSIGVIGPGTVGSVLLDQLAWRSATAGARIQDRPARARHPALASRCACRDSGVDAGQLARGTCRSGSQPADLARFVEHVRVDYLPHTVLIDCTADARSRGNYPHWLAAGIHIVTPNKKANSSELLLLRKLQGARGRASGAHYLYETTVGAGLPVIQTLRDLRETGDEIDAASRASSPAPWRICSMSMTARGRSPPSCARPSSAATPSRIRAMICPARMWRASSSSSAAKWAWSWR